MWKHLESIQFKHQGTVYTIIGRVISVRKYSDRVYILRMLGQSMIEMIVDGRCHIPRRVDHEVEYIIYLTPDKRIYRICYIDEGRRVYLV